jgi:hypothetical protein
MQQIVVLALTAPAANLAPVTAASFILHNVYYANKIMGGFTDWTP